MHGSGRTGRMTRRGAVAASLSTLLAGPAARADRYPSRPIRVIVPFPAGGGYDQTARLLAEPLSRELGQPVVVDNRTGASGLLGMEAAWRSPPDGYTLVLTGAAVVSTAPHLRKLPYEPLGFRHITRLVRMPSVLAVRGDLPARTLPEFVALARKERLTYAAAGVGSSQHLTGELFNQTAGTKLALVPYRGTAPALNDLAGGVVDAAIADASALELIRSGRIRAMAVTSPDRWPLLPDTPAVAEVVPGCVSENWYGLAAPPGTAPEVAEVLASRVGQVMADPALRKRYDEAGLHPATMPGPEFLGFIEKDLEVWGAVVRRGNVRLDAE